MSVTLEGSSIVVSQGKTERLFFVDALRVLIVLFVIVHHAAQAYGPTGGMWPVHDQAQSDWFLPFYTVNAAFGLGLLFLLAGYFVPSSYERKGPRRFLRERWVRIGVPLVSFALLIHLPAVYLLGSHPAPGEFIRRLYENGWQPIYLHLWFIGHLLLYSAVYVAWRQVFVRSDQAPSRWPWPNQAVIGGFVIVVALITWIVRVWYPVDKWVPLLWVVTAEPAHLPQYVALFASGVAAYHGEWLRRIPTTVGMVWLAVGLIAAAGVYVAHAVGRDNLMVGGGLSWSSLVYSTWEMVISAGLVVGLIVLFREVFHRPHRLFVTVASASFGAYILHPAIVVALQAGIQGLVLPAVVRFALVAILGTVLAFGVTYLISNVPGLRVILGTTSAGNRVLDHLRA
jgi:peptidoglycan/LPS O-acetylase OafA/YrhL